MNRDSPTSQTGLPAELGYQMPAEWENHEAVWLSWPCDPATFPDRMERVEEAYLTIIGSLCGSERVNLLVRDGGMRDRVERLLGGAGIVAGDITFHLYDYGDVWSRDYGPTFLVNRKDKRLAMVDWIFNAWGGKYEALLRDTAVPGFINRSLNITSFTPGIVLEGGSIDVNGMGTLLTTEECLLNRNRNPELTRGDIERFLRDYLGVSEIIWLRRGIAGDDTDGHVDDIARFVNPTTVLCAYEEDETDENYGAIRENYEILLGARDQEGRRLEVKKLPMPGRIGSHDQRLPASYVNFYIGNESVLVPTFECAKDGEALDIIGDAFPDRRVVGIDCRDLIYGFGAIHCITQQQPAL